MNSNDEREREGLGKSGHDGVHAPPRARKRKGQPSQVGDALRTVYQRTIDEDIPPEMLDLLGKLG